MRERRETSGIGQAELGKILGVSANSEIRKREEPRERGAPFSNLQGFEVLAIVDG
jgi:hypothetical protein